MSYWQWKLIALFLIAKPRRGVTHQRALQAIWLSFFSLSLALHVSACQWCNLMQQLILQPKSLPLHRCNILPRCSSLRGRIDTPRPITLVSNASRATPHYRFSFPRQLIWRVADDLMMQYVYIVDYTLAHFPMCSCHWRWDYSLSPTVVYMSCLWDLAFNPGVMEIDEEDTEAQLSGFPLVLRVLVISVSKARASVNWSRSCRKHSCMWKGEGDKCSSTLLMFQCLSRQNWEQASEIVTFVWCSFLETFSKVTISNVQILRRYDGNIQVECQENALRHSRLQIVIAHPKSLSNGRFNLCLPGSLLTDDPITWGLGQWGGSCPSFEITLRWLWGTSCSATPLNNPHQPAISLSTQWWWGWFSTIPGTTAAPPLHGNAAQSNWQAWSQAGSEHVLPTLLMNMWPHSVDRGSLAWLLR